MPDIVNMTNSMLIGLARPHRRGAQAVRSAAPSRAKSCFSRADRALRSPRGDAHPPAGAVRRSIHRRQRLLRTSHGELPRHPAQEDFGRAARDQLDRLPAAQPVDATACSASAIWRGSPQRKACTCWPRPSAASDVASRKRTRAARSGRLSRAGASPLSGARSCASSSALDCPASSPITAPSIARASSPSCSPRRAVGAGDLRRTEGHLSPRGDGERRAGRPAPPRGVHRDRRIDRRRSAGQPDDPDAWLKGCTRVARPGAGSRDGPARSRTHADALHCPAFRHAPARGVHEAQEIKARRPERDKGHAAQLRVGGGTPLAPQP